MQVATDRLLSPLRVFEADARQVLDVAARRIDQSPACIDVRQLANTLQVPGHDAWPDHRQLRSSLWRGWVPAPPRRGAELGR